MNLVNIDIDLLRTLVDIAETRNFTTTGDNLLRTQSAISLQIKRLEEVVGQHLLSRGRGKEIRLTPAGELVRGYAQRILRLNDEMLVNLNEGENSSVIRMGMPDDYANLILPEVIRHFSRLNHSIEFELISDSSMRLSKMVDQKMLDVAFMTRSTDVTGFSIGKEEIAWVAAHDIDLENFNTIPLAVFPSGCSVRESAIKALERAGKPWRIFISSNQFEPLRAAILSGRAIGVLPRRARCIGMRHVDKDLHLPEVVPVELVVKVSEEVPDFVNQLAGCLADIFHTTE